MSTPMLNDAIIKLHDVARTIETEVGANTLSDDVRKSAEELNNLIKRLNNEQAH